MQMTIRIHLSFDELPLLTWLALPAVRIPSGHSGSGGHTPSCTKVSSFPNVSTVVPGRTPSSARCCTLSPCLLRPSMATISASTFPAVAAAWALAWLSAAKASQSAREMPYLQPHRIPSKLHQ